MVQWSLVARRSVSSASVRGGSANKGLEKPIDPACRFHGSNEQGSAGVTGREGPRPRSFSADGGAQEAAARPPQIPFTHMTRFVTKGGIGLQYLPGPLDKWIDRQIHTDGEEWTDAMTGKPLSAAEKEQHEKYQQRLADRCCVGEKADKLANIVDSYMPQLANETRAYMIRFPHEVKKLLKKARQIRKKIKARRKRRSTPAASQATPARRAQQQAAAAEPEQDGTTKDKGEEPRSPAAAGEEKTTAPAETEGKEGMTKDKGEEPRSSEATGEKKKTMPAETEGKEFDDVDWGSPDSETWSLEGKKPNRSSSSDLGNARAKNAQQEPTQRRGEPWSAKAQTAKQEPAPRRGGSLGQRPRTPSRSPRRNPVHLRPNHKWRRCSVYKNT